MLKAGELHIGRLVTPVCHKGHRKVADSGWETPGRLNQSNCLIHLDFDGFASWFYCLLAV